MSLLSRFKIRTKLASMVALSALSIFSIIAFSAGLSRSRMLEDRIAQMHTAVDMLVGMAQTLQDDVAAGRMTLADAQAQFRQRARGMKFGKGQGYPLVYRADGLIVLHGASPELEGKPTNSKDANGASIARLIADAANENPEGSTASYHYMRPGETVPLPKIVFARRFEPWD